MYIYVYMYVYSVSSTHAHSIHIEYMVLMLGSHPIISRSPSLAAASLRAIVMYRSRSVPVWLQCVAGCCGVLSCVTIRSSVLQCDASLWHVIVMHRSCSVSVRLQCAAVCCSVLQCVAVSHSVKHRYGT